MKMCRHGGVAQLGEHLLCKQGVIGSIPFTSTKQCRKLGIHEIVEQVSAPRCFDLFDRKIGCRSLKIHRVELALPAESAVDVSAQAGLVQTGSSMATEAAAAHRAVGNI